MSIREIRLRDILELVRSHGPGGIDEQKVIGAIAARYSRSAGTVRDDVEDLEIREWISRTFGRVRITKAGQDVLTAGGSIPAAKGQKRLEGARS